MIHVYDLFFVLLPAPVLARALLYKDQIACNAKQKTIDEETEWG
jgi:hypothetical protein